MNGLSRSDIDEILRLLDQSDFDELRLEMGDTKIEIRRNGARTRSGGRAASAPPATRRPPASPPPASSPTPAVTPTPAASSTPATAPASPPSGPSVAGGSVDVPAPQLGIFYHAPRPGEPPFVSVGDVVDSDTVIGIIEVMKLMNTVAAGIAGTVTEIVAPNGESVKQGDTLIRVDPT